MLPDILVVTSNAGDFKDTEEDHAEGGATNIAGTRMPELYKKERRCIWFHLRCGKIQPLAAIIQSVVVIRISNNRTVEYRIVE
jgi:hypothetical protein